MAYGSSAVVAACIDIAGVTYGLNVAKDPRVLQVDFVHCSSWGSVLLDVLWAEFLHCRGGGQLV